VAGYYSCGRKSLDGGLKGGDLKDGDLGYVLVERLTRAWLKFQSHMSWHRAKINDIMDYAEQGMYEAVSQRICLLAECGDQKGITVVIMNEWTWGKAPQAPNQWLAFKCYKFYTLKHV
jgi:hypothetical protein